LTTLTGLWRLVRLILRRDRFRLTLWVLGLAGTTLASAASLPSLYSSELAIQGYVRTAGDNPAMVAFAGPGHGFDDPNIGVILVNEVQLFTAIGLALMSIFLVNRNTRAEEDSEHAELIRSSVVGRHAPVAAAAIVIAGANLVIGVLLLLGFIGTGYPLAGSVALALSIAAVGLVFAGIAAVVAQFMSGGRATLGVSTAVLGVSFVLRAVGDIADNGLSWLSPLGWGQAIRAYAGEAWWTLGLCVVGAAALVVLAFQLSIRRDLGSGLLPQRPGPAHAKPWLLSPIGLAVRLQRGSLIGWTIGMAVLGAVYGSIGEDIEQMIEDNPALADYMAQIEGVSITDAFYASAA
jgi:ABC-2 type transport system permease protein